MSAEDENAGPDDLRASSTAMGRVARQSHSSAGKENVAEEISLHQMKKDDLQRCYECNGPLTKSKHLVSISGQTNRWHSECFRCNICQKPLENEVSCHIYKDKVLCREDYSQLARDLTTKCSRCHWPIGASDWVRRASQYVYHLACFSCDICQRQLSTGEQFTIRIVPASRTSPKSSSHFAEVRLLCRLHFAIEQTDHQSTVAPINGSRDEDISTAPREGEEDKFLDMTSTSEQLPTMASSPAAADIYLHLLASTSSQQPRHTTTTTTASSSSSFSVEEQSAADQQQFQLNENQAIRLHQHRHHHPHQACDQQPIISSPNDSSSTATTTATNGSAAAINQQQSSSCHNSLASLASKSKRVRTTFTENQLDILQTHFQIDSNPDGQDLERIAVITGLTKRVTQVWFQNSRARQKKYMTKRKPPNVPSAPPQSQATNNPQHHHHHHQQQQQQQQSYSSSIAGDQQYNGTTSNNIQQQHGDCFAVKMDDINSVAHKWLNMIQANAPNQADNATRNSFSAASMSSRGLDNDDDDGLDEDDDSLKLDEESQCDDSRTDDENEECNQSVRMKGVDSSSELEEND